MIKKIILSIPILLFFALFGAFAQAEEDRTFSERLEEGVRSNTPSRMTFYGELYARGWYGGHKGNRFIQGADMKGDDSFIGILWEFTNHTGAVFELNAFPEENGMNAYFNKAYLYTDLAGEAGAKNFMAKLSLGRFGFDSEFYSPVDPMNTGDDMQHDGNLDTLNWKLEMGTKGDLYPLIVMLAGDLDFGYRGEGVTGMNNFNNRGVSGMVEVRSPGFTIGNTNISWNVYYMGVFNPKVAGNAAGDKYGESYVNKTQHSMGGTVGVSVGLSEGHTLKTGAALEYDMWSYGGNLNGTPFNPGKTFQALDWQAGVGYVMANQFAVGLGVRQNAYQHAEYAAVTGNAPLSDMHAGLSFHYLGLKETAKISLFAGVAYAFGSLYFSDLYKKAWDGNKDGTIYDGSKVLVNSIASTPLSVDVGIGYHPVSNASIILGYNYGTWGLEAPDGPLVNVPTSWGKVYVKGAYIW